MNESHVEARAERLLRFAAVVLSALFVLLFLYVAFRRLRYPFEIDRVESGMMTSVWRLRQGYPLYAAPSLTWASFLYAPLFFYLSAALSKVMGVSYAPLRMVSILSTLGSFGVICVMVWKETGRRAGAIAAVGLFASLYLLVFGWFDVGRVDSLSVFLFLLAVLATRRSHPLVAAVFWLLAFQSKQTFLPLGIAMFVVEWQRPRRMLMGMAAFGVMAWGSVVWLNHVTGHWYSFYAFGTAAGLAWNPRVAAMFPLADVVGPWPVVVVVIVAAVIFTPMRWREREGSFFAIVTALMVGAVWFVRAHEGANVNALLPLYAWMAVLAGVAMNRLLERGSSPQVLLLWLAIVVQLAAHVYRPGELIPTAAELATRQQFLTSVRETPGDVWLVNHSYDGILAGKPMHAEMDAYDAVLGRPYAPAVAEFNRQVAAQEFSAVVLDAPAEAYAPHGVFSAGAFAQVYRLRERVYGSGARDQPGLALLPCRLEGERKGLLGGREMMVDRSRCLE